MPQGDETLFDRAQLEQRNIRLVDGLHFDPSFPGISTGNAVFVGQAEEIANRRDAGMIIHSGRRHQRPDQTLDDHPQLAQQEDTVRLAVVYNARGDLHREPIRLQLPKELSQRYGATGIMVHRTD